jgi:hypothetical protein
MLAFELQAQAFQERMDAIHSSGQRGICTAPRKADTLFASFMTIGKGVLKCITLLLVASLGIAAAYAHSIHPQPSCWPVWR